MSESVFWIVEGIINEGVGDDLRVLIDEMVAGTKANEPGTIAYEWFVDAGRTRCSIYERYRDSAAAIIHLRTFDEKFAQRLERLIRIERLTLFGNASEDVLKMLGGEGTLVLLPMTGFTR